jgi:hypothetical protein
MMRAITIRVAGAAILASALLSAIAAGQQPSASQPARSAEVQTGSDVWIAPQGVQVSVDRRSGRISMSLPTQPVDGSKEQTIRFEDGDCIRTRATAIFQPPAKNHSRCPLTPFTGQPIFPRLSNFRFFYGQTEDAEILLLSSHDF